MKRFAILVLSLAAVSLATAACGGSAASTPTSVATATATATATAASEPTATPTPNATPTAAATPTATLAGDPVELGTMLFREKGCSACHGFNAEGAFGPPLAGHTREQVFTQVRTPKDLMPAFSTEEVSDAELDLIVAFILSLEGEGHHHEEDEALHEDNEVHQEEADEHTDDGHMH